MIVISAASFEQQLTLDVLSQTKISVQSIECGIGSIKAARDMFKWIEKIKNKDVLFIGTCGTFGTFTGIELVTPKKIYWLPTGDRIGASESIENAQDSGVNIEPQSLTTPLRKVDVVCGPSISFRSDLPDWLVAESTVENLELFSLAENIKKFSKSFSIILGVTNKIHNSARDEWRQNYLIAAESQANFVKRNIKNEVTI